MTKRKPRISVVIADDHPAVLHGVAGVLRLHADIKVVAECADGAVALKAIRELAPDVAVLDVAMPGMSGLDVLSSMAADGSGTKVVFLTATGTDEQIVSGVARGLKGLVLKDTSLDGLVQCIREVAAGRISFPLELVAKAAERETARRRQSDEVAGALTSRERQVALLVANGLSNKDIGRQLNVSEGTVKIHLHNIYEKLGVPNRAALTALAITHRKRFEA